MSRFSIVMPIYNTGADLYKALSSVMLQTDKNWDLLMIDDHSTDPLTIEIEETFANYDSRFKLYKCDYGKGAAACRNFGLDICNSDAVLFLDSDDVFCSEMLSIYDSTLRANPDAQVCIGSFIMQDRNTKEKSFIMPKQMSGTTDRMFSMSELPIDALSFWMPVPWNKIYKSDFIKKTKIRFQDLSNCNDMYFGYASVLAADKIIYCPIEKPLLVYDVNNRKSVSYNMDSRNMIKAFEKLIENSSQEVMDKIVYELKRVLPDFIKRCVNEKYNKECIEKAQRIINAY